MDDNGYDMPAVKDEEDSFIEKEEDYGEENGQLAVDVFQNDNEVVIQSIVAGVKPDDLDISIDKNSVTIRGKKRKQPPDKKRKRRLPRALLGRFQPDDFSAR